MPEQYLPEWTPLTRDDAGLIRVESNFFHHNALDGGGYGVTVGSGAFATIMGNVFDFNRHAVASDGFAKTGYIARFNYILEGGFKQGNIYNQHFDVHGTNDTNGDDKSTGYGGTAGDYYEIAYNAIRGDQGYYCFIICLKTRSRRDTARQAHNRNAFRCERRGPRRSRCGRIVEDGEGRHRLGRKPRRIQFQRCRQSVLPLTVRVISLPAISTATGGRMCLSPPAQPGSSRGADRKRGSFSMPQTSSLPNWVLPTSTTTEPPTFCIATVLAISDS